MKALSWVLDLCMNQQKMMTVRQIYPSSSEIRYINICNQYTVKRHGSLGHVQDLFSNLLPLLMNISLFCCKSGQQVLGETCFCVPAVPCWHLIENSQKIIVEMTLWDVDFLLGVGWVACAGTQHSIWKRNTDKTLRQKLELEEDCSDIFPFFFILENTHFNSQNHVKLLSTFFRALSNGVRKTKQTVIVFKCMFTEQDFRFFLLRQNSFRPSEIKFYPVTIDQTRLKQ